jgi:glucose 1-dehydrogenase
MTEKDFHQSTSVAGKVVIVTGSSSGIGAGIAARFAEAGASVVINANKNADGLAQVAKQITDAGGKVVAVQANVSDPAGVDKLFKTAIEKFSRVDVIVNNAGLQPIRTLLEMDASEWDLVVGTNMRSVFLCTQAAAKQMIAQGDGGVIVNISSIEGDSPAPNHTHYGASKAGINNFTKGSALELGEHGIRVNAIAPGLIWREGLENDWPSGVSRWKDSAPLKRLGKALDVADACLFLASPAAEWITGVILPVDGGVLATQTY